MYDRGSSDAVKGNAGTSTRQSMDLLDEARTELNVFLVM